MHPSVLAHSYPFHATHASRRFVAHVGAHVGLVRDRMEDAWCVVLDRPVNGAGVDAFGVFDGLGGLMHGQEAAWAAADGLAAAVARAGPQGDVLAALNRDVLATGGLTTAVVAVATEPEGTLRLLGAGDSSAWILDRAGRPARALPLDLDPEGNPTQSLGVETLRPRNGTVRLDRGAAILLCTDGIDGFLPERAIADALRDAGEPEAIRRLLAAVIDAGGQDNAAAILVHRP